MSTAEVVEDLQQGAIEHGMVEFRRAARLKVAQGITTDEEILRELRIVYWRFLPDAGRQAAAAQVERVLRAGLEQAPTQSPKGAYFATLRSVVAGTLQQAQDRLEARS